MGASQQRAGNVFMRIQPASKAGEPEQIISRSLYRNNKGCKASPGNAKQLRACQCCCLGHLATGKAREESERSKAFKEAAAAAGMPWGGALGWGVFWSLPGRSGCPQFHRRMLGSKEGVFLPVARQLWVQLTSASYCICRYFRCISICVKGVTHACLRVKIL